MKPIRLLKRYKGGEKQQEVLMRRLFIFLFALTWTWAAATASEPSPAEKQAMQAVIAAQLNAFESDRNDEAYSYAAPLIKNYFGSVDNFMMMVQRGYEPVRRHKSFTFGAGFSDQLGRNAQRVVIDADDGKRYEALYTLEKQPDGSWKINGCTLLEIAATDV
jgi:hypothetical protein